MKMYITLLLTAALALSAGQDAQAAEPEPLPLAHIDHPYQRVEQLFSAIPSGTSLDRPQFEPAMGADVAEYLNLLGTIHVDSLNGAIKLDLSNLYNGKTKGGTRIQMDKQLSFTYRRDSNGTIDCHDIVGLRVKPFRLLGWMPLKEIVVTQDTAGNTRIAIVLDTIIGTVNYSKTLGQDGQPLSK
jgi:hypothetical protein